MMRLFRSFGMYFLVTVICAVAANAFAQESPKPTKAKNIILMIGDGMGFNHYIAGAYWRYGELGHQSVDSFPVHCAMTTARARSTTPVPNNYPCYLAEKYWSGPKVANDKTELTEVTDSASAATAMYGGVKTTSGRVGVDADKKPVELASEVADAKGKSTGIVSTMFYAHATPGVFWMHTSARDKYDEISDFMLHKSGLDVIMGAGHPKYDENAKLLPEDKFDFKYVGGEEIWNEITSKDGVNGFTLIETRTDFEKLAKAEKGDLPKKVLGVAHTSKTIAAVDGEPSTCPASPEVIEKAIGGVSVKEIPSLSTMSVGALNVLSQNENGFIVMIEGGHMDGACHARNLDRMIVEQTGFAKAIDAVVDWVEQNSSWDETLLIVAADHETGFLWGDGSYIDKDGDGKFDEKKDEFVAYQPVESSDCGQLPKMQQLSSGHTNTLVPVWVKGVGAEEIEKYYYGTDEKAAEVWDFSGKYIDNTHLGQFMKEHL